MTTNEESIIESSKNKLQRTLGPLFTVGMELTNPMKITTPFLLPDGEVLDLYLVSSETGTIVTDLGNALDWLKIQTSKTHDTWALEEIVTTLAVSYIDGHLQKSVAVQGVEETAMSIMRVGQAALCLASLWLSSEEGKLRAKWRSESYPL